MNWKQNSVISRTLFAMAAICASSAITGCNRNAETPRSESKSANSASSETLPEKRATPADTTVPGAAAPGAPAAATSNSNGDRDFMMNAAVGNLFEVQVGEMAAKRATSADVKAFAQMLVRHHGAANDELAALAKSKNVTLPNKIPAAKQGAIDSLAKTSNEQFDREFIRTIGLADHQEDIKAFEAASRSVGDPALKSWIDKTLPTLREHLATARRLEPTTTGAKSSLPAGKS